MCWVREHRVDILIVLTPPVSSTGRSTDSGRIVASAVMLVGIGFLATLTPAIGDRLVVSGRAPEARHRDGIAECLDRIEGQLAA